MPQIGAITMPATAASAVPSAKTPRPQARQVVAEARTISLSCAPALMMAPTSSSR
jgi:hypothetical protein